MRKTLVQRRKRMFSRNYKRLMSHKMLAITWQNGLDKAKSTIFAAAVFKELRLFCPRTPNFATVTEKYLVRGARQTSSLNKVAFFARTYLHIMIKWHLLLIYFDLHMCVHIIHRVLIRTFVRNAKQLGSAH